MAIHDPAPSAPRRGGLPLLAPVGAYVALSFAAFSTYPPVLPTDSAADVLATVRAAAGSAQLSAMFLVAAGAALLVWSTSAAHRLRALGGQGAGPLFALVGGALAGTSLMLSGLAGSTSATLSAVGDAAVVKALATVTFLTGGVGFALGSALLIAGVALPCLAHRFAPRPVAALGLVVAFCGVLALGSMVVYPMSYLLPITRFAGMLWLIAVSVLLPVAGGHPGAHDAAETEAPMDRASR